ncbi:uncharacterized protein LOC9650052 [Selaginella moellendorffii]|uniref:uncharacterized protein LOC9650052 n=1 Tax=Selaginella moellendorffii TaxID=88036 RepID=UPI000D1C7AFE|nr:uncharacterized protein LOC9650052 [Selaginella moellendorffii]|eukprot:XP_024518782.1 uncharacterized protein LOC9650052 [Selaginella moellendorffii]
MDDVFSTPVCIVYVHPAEERGRNVDDLRAKLAFRAVPSDIKNSGDLVNWLKTVLKVDAVLSSKGWMEIPTPDPGAHLPPTFELHLRKSIGGATPFAASCWSCYICNSGPELCYPVHSDQPVPRRENIRLRNKLHELESGAWHVRESAAKYLGLGILQLVDGAAVSVGDYEHSVQPERHRPFWLCVKFEEKRATLEEAYQDLINKLGVLPPQYYEPVQWIVGVALAGPEMAGWAMRQGQTPDDLFGRLNMGSLRDKTTCLRLSINFLRIALTISSIYSKLNFLPRPFNVLPPAFYGSLSQITRTLRIVYPKVIKEIRPWSQHVAEGFTTTAFVTQAYGLGAVGLVSGVVKVRAERYNVVIQSVGYEQMISSEEDLWPAVQSALHGLHALHQGGLVHRDIRWKNILKLPASNGSWMLIDLETVWKTDCTPSCWLRAWDDNTLVDGVYTRSSDLYLVGRLMESFRDLSPEAKEFQAKLLRHEFLSAQEALHYLSR